MSSAAPSGFLLLLLVFQGSRNVGFGGLGTVMAVSVDWSVSAVIVQLQTIHTAAIHVQQYTNHWYVVVC